MTDGLNWPHGDSARMEKPVVVRVSQRDLQGRVGGGVTVVAQ